MVSSLRGTAERGQPRQPSALLVKPIPRAPAVAPVQWPDGLWYRPRWQGQAAWTRLSLVGRGILSVRGAALERPFPGMHKCASLARCIHWKSRGGTGVSFEWPRGLKQGHPRRAGLRTYPAAEFRSPALRPCLPCMSPVPGIHWSLDMAGRLPLAWGQAALCPSREALQLSCAVTRRCSPHHTTTRLRGRVVREPLRSYYSLAAAGQRGAGLAGGAAGKAGPGEAEADVGAAELQAAVDGDADAGQDLKDVQDILETMELLKEKRQMTVSEVRLVLVIEDPREVERRKQLGVESPSGCSREEIAAAFTDVMEDRVPADRLALRTLAQEMRDWPRLREEDEPAGDAGERDGKRKRSLYAEVTDVGLSRGAPETPAAGEWDAAADAAITAAAKAKDQQKDLGETLPSWVGYGVLYGVSGIPIVIGVLVVVILFLNSLQ